MSGSEIDWLAVEADYRPNIISLRAIGEKHGCTEGAIRKKAKKEGWVRDLSEKIKSKADDLVRKEAVRAEYAATTEREIIEANAVASANIQLSERKDVSRARMIAMDLMNELESQTTNKELYENLGEILSNPDFEGNVAKISDAYNKILSFGGRTDSMKKLAETLRILVELERKVYKIEEASEGGVEDFLRKIRNV